MREAPPAPPEAAAPAPAELPLSERSRADVAAARGVSSFDTAAVGRSSPVSETAAVDAITVSAVEVTRATGALEHANRVVADHEAGLARELAHLAPGLPTERLQAFADSFRAEHAADYDAAASAASRLSEVLTAQADSIESTLSVTGSSIDRARADLTTRLEDATDALATQISQSPQPNDALQLALSRTADRWESVAEVANTASTISGVSRTAINLALAPSGMSELASRARAPFGILGDAASAAGIAARAAAGETTAQDVLTASKLAAEHAGLGRVAGSLGVVGSVIDATSAGELIRDGNARAEHYVAGGVAIAEIGIGVAAVAGVTVGLPVTATVGAIGLAANTVANARDEAAFRRGMADRLGELGYSPDLAQGLANVDAGALAAFRERGFSVDDLQSITAQMQSNGTIQMLNDGFANRLADAAQRLEIDPGAMTSLLQQLGSDAPNFAMSLTNWEVDSQIASSPMDRASMLDRMQSGPEAFQLAAEWLERQS